jgi:2-amino-4-hydroxy-6-hydroxymethyldihydropteridine diphosphokinase
MQIYLGLGSNLENPTQQLNSARKAIAQIDGIVETAFSTFYRSPPMDAMQQPDYVNAVMGIETDLLPLELLELMQKVENEHGRVRIQRWGARTLDIDILLFGNEIVKLPDLVIPHYGMAQRAFVLYPLFEIAPDLDIPGQGKLIDLLKNCPCTRID